MQAGPFEQLPAFTDIDAIEDLRIEDVVVPVGGADTQRTCAIAYRHRRGALRHVSGKLVGRMPVALLDAVRRLSVIADLLDRVEFTPPDMEMVIRHLRR